MIISKTDRRIGNKLLAEFMGYTEHYHGSYTTFEKDGVHIFESVLQYDTKWEWIMPVVQKFMGIPIEKFNYNAPAMTELRQCKRALSGLSITSDIGTVWNHLLSNVKWLNSQATK